MSNEFKLSHGSMARKRQQSITLTARCSARPSASQFLRVMAVLVYRILRQHLLQPQLIGGIQDTFSLKLSGHELGHGAVFGDGHADHRPLRHRGIMLLALERPVFCLICKPTKIKDTTTPIEATICAR